MGLRDGLDSLGECGGIKRWSHPVSGPSRTQGKGETEAAHSGLGVPLSKTVCGSREKG